jgi:hypothetical protein
MPVSVHPVANKMRSGRWVFAFFSLKVVANQGTAAVGFGTIDVVRLVIVVKILV